jgi:acyl-CoA synthetase (AMP-forming)/AMP-acid ligase II
VKATINKFASVCRADPDRPLLHLPATETTLTASQLADHGDRYQAGLAALGIKPGELVLCGAGNRRGAIPLVVACWSLGSPILPVDVGTPLDEMFQLADRFRAGAMVLPLSVVAGRLPDAVALDDELAVVKRDVSAVPEYRDAALLKLTSGSTGEPKAVLTTEPQLFADSDHIISAMGIEPTDTQLAVIPLSHAYGFGNLVMPLLLQGTAVVLRESFVPHQLTGDARRYRARAFHGVPFMFHHYVANPPPGGWPPSLTLLVSAGARLELDTIHGFHDAFGVKIHSFYGTTESGGIAYDASDNVPRVATVGRLLPGVTVELRPDDGVPDGYGRIHVAGSAVARQYVGTNDSTDLDAGGFLAGDYGLITERGELVLVGRVSTFVNVAGRKVQPDEVERVLRQIPGVTDVRVLAAPDAVRGEQIAAVVAGHADLTLTSIRLHCARELAPHKIPRIVVRVDAIPLTVRGKTDHRALSDLVQQRANSST